MDLINFSTNFTISIEISLVLSYTMSINLQKEKIFMAYRRTSHAITNINLGTKSIPESTPTYVVLSFFSESNNACSVIQTRISSRVNIEFLPNENPEKIVNTLMIKRFYESIKALKYNIDLILYACKFNETIRLRKNNSQPLLVDLKFLTSNRFKDSLDQYIRKTSQHLTYDLTNNNYKDAESRLKNLFTTTLQESINYLNNLKCEQIPKEALEIANKIIDTANSTIESIETGSLQFSSFMHSVNTNEVSTVEA